MSALLPTLRIQRLRRRDEGVLLRHIRDVWSILPLLLDPQAALATICGYHLCCQALSITIEPSARTGLDFLLLAWVLGTLGVSS